MKTKIKFPNTSTPSSVSGMKINNKDVLYLKRNGVTYYTKHFKVTTNLTGVSLATYNTPEYKQPLSLSFVPDTGLQLLPSTVRVTMGGVDITNTAFDFGTRKVTLANVTGNVTIEAIGASVDAEVEYLESDGVAYIDTGIKPKSSYTFNTKVTMIQSVYNCVFWGCRSSGTYSSNNSQCYLNYNTRQISPTVCLYSTAISDTSNWSSGAGMTLNEEYSYYGITCVSSMNDMTQPVTLFGLNNQGVVDASSGICRIGGLTVYDNGVKVMELIPVRKDNVGYMYDKVSGQLFGNAASSGAFTFGSDVTSNETNSLSLNNGLLGQASGNESNNESNEMENI